MIRTVSLVAREVRLLKNSANLNLSHHLKKEKDFFFSFRIKMTTSSSPHIGRMSGALCDFDER
jgi:hypothetical protein